jgi:hypothetical protein
VVPFEQPLQSERSSIMVLTPNAVLDLYLLLVDLAATPVLHRYSRAIMVLESWYQAGVALQPSCVHESSGLVHTRSSATTVVCCPPNRHRVAGISIDGSHPPLHALPEKWTGSCDGAFYNCPQQFVYRNHRNTDIRRGCFALQSVSYGPMPSPAMVSTWKSVSDTSLILCLWADRISLLYRISTTYCDANVLV